MDHRGGSDVLDRVRPGHRNGARLLSRRGEQSEARTGRAARRLSSCTQNRCVLIRGGRLRASSEDLRMYLTTHSAGTHADLLSRSAFTHRIYTRV